VEVVSALWRKHRLGLVSAEDAGTLVRRFQAEFGGSAGVVPRFSLMSLAADETPGLDSFICAHLTPELMRRPEWLVHANGAVGVKGVHVLVGGTAPLIAAWLLSRQVPWLIAVYIMVISAIGGITFLKMRETRGIALD